MNEKEQSLWKELLEVRGNLIEKNEKSVKQLCEEHGLGETTVRRKLNELELEGKVTRREVKVDGIKFFVYRIDEF